MVEAAVDHDAIHPGAEGGIAAKFGHARKQLEERILGDVHGERFVAAEAQGDRVDLVLVGLEQGAKCIPLAAAAPVNELAIRPLQHHPGHETMITRIFFRESWGRAAAILAGEAQAE